MWSSSRFDLVDVEDAAVRLGEQSGFEATLAVLDRGLGVDGADHAVLGGVDRELHDPDALPDDRRVATIAVTRAAVVAPVRGRGRVAPVAAAGDDVDLREEAGQGPDGRRLRGAPLPADEDAADVRVDRVEDQRGLHRVLPDERRERHEGT